MGRPVAAGLVSGRSCDGCALCCILPEIAEFEKPANQPCRHCLSTGGCATYAARPSTCQDFFCLWRTDATLSEAWDPVRTGMMLYRQGAQLTLLVDPSAEAVWSRDPYRADLALRVAALQREGGYVVVYRGEEVSVLRG